MLTFVLAALSVARMVDASCQIRLEHLHLVAGRNPQALLFHHLHTCKREFLADKRNQGWEKTKRKKKKEKERKHKQTNKTNMLTDGALALLFCFKLFCHFFKPV
jgi:hypothetical protein